MSMLVVVLVASFADCHAVFTHVAHLVLTRFVRSDIAPDGVDNEFVLGKSVVLNLKKLWIVLLHTR